MRPPCPWREAEAADLRPEVPGRLDREDVGFVSPGHSPGCEQEEAAAHPGRPHPGEWPGRAAGPVTLVHLRSARGGHRGGARHAERLGPRPGPASQPPRNRPTPPHGEDKQTREGLLRGCWCLGTTFPIRPCAAACWAGGDARARPREVLCGLP